MSEHNKTIIVTRRPTGLYVSHACLWLVVLALTVLFVAHVYRVDAEARQLARSWTSDDRVPVMPSTGEPSPPLGSMKHRGSE